MRKYKLKKAFTLTEMIMVIAIIWVLMMWMTVYIWWSSERTKIIEAEWCATSFWWKIDNYLYYALTSRMLQSWDDQISPNFYYIQLSWWTLTSDDNCVASNFTWDSPIFCNEIVFSYSTWNLGYTDHPTVYETNTIQKTCRQNNTKIWFYWSGWSNAIEENIEYIKMNKWFSPSDVANRNVFYLENSARTYQPLRWEIMIVMCSDERCTWWKQIAKRVVDARSQTISLKKCKFYKDDDLRLCKTWEDENE